MATFNTKERQTYQNICHLTVTGVLSLMHDLLKPRYENVIATPAYLYAIGDIPVALVAHADTVFRTTSLIDNFYYDQEKDVIWNVDGAGADDRAGIFAIVKIIKETKLRPHIIITTGEEIGCVGAIKLTSVLKEFPADLRFMIQLDRRNHDDSVFYDCDNKKFEDFINNFGFKTEWGTLSDISVLAPHFKVAAVNLSVGYVDEHTTSERLHVNWLYETIDKVINILTYVKNNINIVPVYEYIPLIYDSYWLGNYGYTGYTGKFGLYDYCYNDNDDDDILADYGHCFLCNKFLEKESMIPIWYPYEKKSYNMCINCFSKHSNQIVWCKTCNKGVYLNAAKVKEIPDLNNWECEECKYGFNKTSGAV